GGYVDAEADIRADRGARSMTGDGLNGTVEALLFLSPDPVSAAELAEAIEVDEETVAGVLDQLERGLEADGRGVRLRRVAGGYALAAVPEAEDAARRLLAKPRTPPLTHGHAGGLATRAIHPHLSP